MKLSFSVFLGVLYMGFPVSVNLSHLLIAGGVVCLWNNSQHFLALALFSGW